MAQMRSITSILYSSHEAVKAVAEEGFRPLGLGQVIENRLVRGVFWLGAIFFPSSRVKNMLADQEQSLLEAAKRQVMAGGELTEDMIYDIVQEKFETGVFSQILRKNLTPEERAWYLLDNGNEHDIADLVRRSGGLDSDAVRAVKASVYARILRQAVSTGVYAGWNPRDILASGFHVLDPADLLETAKTLRESGNLDPLFKPEDWARLRNFEAYATKLASTCVLGLYHGPGGCGERTAPMNNR